MLRTLNSRLHLHGLTFVFHLVTRLCWLSVMSSAPSIGSDARQVLLSIFGYHLLIFVPFKLFGLIYVKVYMAGGSLRDWGCWPWFEVDGKWRRTCHWSST